MRLPCRFDLDGAIVRINRLETQGEKLIFSGYAQIEHFPGTFSSNQKGSVQSYEKTPTIYQSSGSTGHNASKREGYCSNIGTIIRK
jgi:hypothetical protein